MIVEIGDSISWEHEDLEYLAEVIFVSDDGFHVSVVYDNIGLTQDIIAVENVLRVWKKEKIND